MKTLIVSSFVLLLLSAGHCFAEEASVGVVLGNMDSEMAMITYKNKDGESTSIASLDLQQPCNNATPSCTNLRVLEIIPFDNVAGRPFVDPRIRRQNPAQLRACVYEPTHGGKPTWEAFTVKLTQPKPEEVRVQSVDCQLGIAVNGATRFSGSAPAKESIVPVGENDRKDHDTWVRFLHEVLRKSGCQVSAFYTDCHVGGNP